MSLPSLTFDRSEQLAFALINLIDHPLYNDSGRVVVSNAFCRLIFEHALAVVQAIRAEFYSSAFVLHRSQFEALVRAAWVLYAANDLDIQKLSDELNHASQRRAGRLPMPSDMLKQLEANPVAAIPLAALAEFKQYAWAPLNSFVHAGIHPLSRGNSGYPPALLEMLLRTANGLFHLAAMHSANLTGIPGLQKKVVAVCDRFWDVLPAPKGADSKLDLEYGQ